MVSNISFVTVPAINSRYDGLMSAETSALATLAFNFVNIAICVLGVATNAINALVFLRTGSWSNATSTTFLALTFSDLTFLLLMLVFTLLRVVSKLYGQVSGVPPMYIAFALVSYWHWAYNTSVCFTVFLSVQKACCVAIPLTFKNVFTVPRTVVTLVFIVLGLLAFYLPMMSTMSISQTLSMTTNVSAYTLSFAPKTVSSTFDLTMQNILPTVTLVIVIISLAVLVVKLRQASSLRAAMTVHQVEGERETSGKEDRSRRKDGAREVKAIQAVTAVSTMFVLCNLPPILVTYATFIEPEFNDFRYYGNLYAVVGSARLTLQIVCATVNIIVYYYFNTTFRTCLVKIFCRRKAE